MGEVYDGFDETLKRRVTLKAIRADHCGGISSAMFSTFRARRSVMR